MEHRDEKKGDWLGKRREEDSFYKTGSILRKTTQYYKAETLVTH